VRVCYLVQTHRSPRQISRLVAALARGGAAFVLVAHDESGSEIPERELRRAAPDLHVLRVPGPIRRGYLSMLAPYFAGIRWLADERVEYDWLAYISGQDYPVQPLARSERELEEATCDGFLRFWPALGGGGQWRRSAGLHRYYYRYRDAPPWLHRFMPVVKAITRHVPFVRVHDTYGPRLGVRARSPFRHRTCYGGYQWTTLRRACVELLRESVERERELVEHYRSTVCPDESLVQTILVNSGRFRFTNDNRRFVDFGDTRDGHPRLLTAADLDTLTSGGYHFARKFDLERDPAVFDLLDERLAASPTAG
jgi:hypothetical protein